MSQILRIRSFVVIPLLLLLVALPGCKKEVARVSNYESQVKETNAALRERQDAMPEYAFDLYRKTHLTHLALEDFVRSSRGFTKEIKYEEDDTWYTANAENKAATERLLKLIKDTQDTLLRYAHFPALSPIQGKLFDGWTRLQTVAGLIHDKQPIGILRETSVDSAAAADNGAELYVRETASMLEAIAVFSETLYDPDKEQSESEIVPEIVPR